MDLLNKAIDKTIAYGKGYGVIYGQAEIVDRLISSKVYLEKDIKKCLNTRVINESKQSVVIKTEKIRLAQLLASNVERIFPGILMVAVTGSVAAGYPDQDDDIDLMIITKEKQLWLMRLLLRIYVGLMGIPHRKYGKEENCNDFCFNLWIEEDSLGLPENKQNLRNAMDSILMIPVLNKNYIYENFIYKNPWLKNYVATKYARLTDNGFSKSNITNKTNWFISLMNWLSFWPQWWYMKGKISNEVVDIKRAFFHPSDRIRYANKNID